MDLAHLLESWREEKRSAWLYRQVASAEAGSPRQGLFLELAQAAEAQAEVWAEQMRKAGATPPEAFRPDLRTRLVGWLVGRLGPRALRPVLAAMKVRGMSLYTKVPVGHALPTDVSQIGRRHASVGAGNNLRAAVFGVNDGLVSNTSLILGVAGANPDPAVIVLAGAAGLLAGAFSMAAGEYVSVRSQREMYEYQIGLERAELDQYPEEEAAELALIFEHKGMTQAEAKRLSETLIADPERALDTLAREELGLNPEDLGSPWGAAMSSFLSFAVGAALPLLPYLLAPGRHALVFTVGLSAAGLFGVGAVLSLYTGRSAWRGGLRMLAIGGLAGLATYLTGKVLGVSLA